MANPPAAVKDATGQEVGAENAQWGNIAADRLRSIVERIERLEEERRALSSDVYRRALGM